MEKINAFERIDKSIATSVMVTFRNCSSIESRLQSEMNETCQIPVLKD